MTDFDALTHDQQLGILQETAEAATANYDLPADVSVEMINLSENATYKIAARDGRRWALRIHREGYHSRTAIQSELAWLADLRQTGIVPTPVPVAGGTVSKSSLSAMPDWRIPAMSCCRNGRPVRSRA